LPPAPVVFLATPCYGGLASARYMRSLIALRSACADRNIRLHVELSGGEALIGRGRAAVMAKFLAGDATHLLFIDADIAFPPDALFRLLEAGQPVVGGLCPRKDPPGGRPASDVEELPGAGSESPRRVTSVGAGFLLIARSAAEQLVRAHPELRANLGDLSGGAAQHAVMLFDSFVDRQTRRYFMDHEAFCHRWRAIGGEVWADFTIPLERIATAVTGPATPA
jgi:hypothetical protein